MSNYDERVNDEADQHSRMMNKKREGWDEEKQPKVYFASARIVWERDVFTVTDKDDNNE